MGLASKPQGGEELSQDELDDLLWPALIGCLGCFAGRGVGEATSTGGQLSDRAWDMARQGSPADAKLAINGAQMRVDVTRISLAGLLRVGYARLSSSTGMERTPAVWRAYSAKPG